MSWEKIKLLCWKNFTLQKRHPIAALFEIAFPIILVVIFTLIRGSLDPQSEPIRRFESFDVGDYSSCGKYSFGRISKVGISPSSNPALVGLVKTTVGLKLEVEVFETASELNAYLTNASETVVGIEFSDKEANSSNLPTKLEYAIRLPQDVELDTWKTSQLFEQSLTKSARDVSQFYPHIPPYMDYCFIKIQNDIERGFLAKVSKKSLPPLRIQRFPYPAILNDLFIVFAGQSFPLLFVLCLIMASKNIIKNVTIEREMQLKEILKIMGLSSTMHWLAWYIKCFIMLQLSIIPMIILMCTPIMTPNPIFALSNPLIVWIFFSLFATSVITFCFLISVLFKKATTAGNVGSILFFVSYLPFSMASEKFASFPYIVKILYAALVNSGMGQGILMMMISEGNEEGLKFSNLFSRDVDLGFSFGEIMLSMILGIVTQMLLTNYIEKVFPGDIGIPEVWYFPLVPCYEFLRKKIGYNTLVNREAMLQDRRISGSEFEEEPLDLKVGIRISNLCKTFDGKPAVNNLNMNIYEDQITMLLGHNGAGKTTTMSMLTGMYPPSSGTAYLNGKDIRTEIDEARTSLGLCPQHNILFDELTVREHIVFFSRLKGITGTREIDEEVKRYINLLELNDKVNSQSSTLSGGMKRKLSIGIALCGNSKIVMCDEPSSGMDPQGRRALWDLLISEKKGRTILLTTHHMDEADVLGDRIAIMAHGQLRTVGSSFFLKKKYGTGYRLICVKQSQCNTNRILQILREFAPEVHIESESQTEAIFIISEDHLPIFQNIFKRLEDEAGEIGVSSFGCNLSTLEEVFLKLGTESQHVGDEDHPDGMHREHGSTSVLVDNPTLPQKTTSTKLMFYQMEAMFLKKFHYFRRNYRPVIVMAIYSAVFIGILMSAPKITFFNAPARTITLDDYQGSITVLKTDGSSPEIFKSYQEMLGDHEIVVTTEEIEPYMLKVGNKSLAMLNKKYMIGAEFTKSIFTVWFNGQPLHTLPLTVNTINRAILKSFNQNSDIILTNKPFSWSASNDDDGHSFRTPDESGFFSIFFLFLFLAIYWPSVFIVFYIKERESRAKLLQLISGANRFIYWITAFLFDFVIFAIIFSCIIGGIAIFQREHFSTAGEIGTYWLIFMLYGFGTLPFIYTFSYLFKNHATGESLVAVAGIVLAILYGIYAIMKYVRNEAFYHFLANIIYWIGMLIGPFNFVDCLRVIGKSILMETKQTLFTFGDDGLLRNFLMLFIGGLLFLTICLLKDHMLFDWLIYKFMTSRRALPKMRSDTDEDVIDENNRIKNMSELEIEHGNLVLKGISKYYGSQLAVNQLYLAVEGSECFGLLGINGAGKTTTFKMMTGDETISSGDAFVQGYSMRNQMHKVHQMIGYCPQFDALLVDLTGRETLKIFSLLRGIPRHTITETINKLSIDLGFYVHLDKKISAYSGGNKRKLSTALSLIGDPSLIFLDEPTTGMDAGAKRQLWNIINKTRNSGRSVVMTSHSMEECEALCTKLAIMVNGVFKCLGSTQHLKNKYSKGCVLTVKTGRDEENFVNEVKNRVTSTFPSAEMKEKYLDILTFYITSIDLKWSQVFEAMAKMKADMGLADYALTQTSLEQVFLFFSKTGLHNSPTN